MGGHNKNYEDVLKSTLKDVTLTRTTGKPRLCGVPTGGRLLKTAHDHPKATE